MENKQSYQQSQYPKGYVEITMHVLLLILTFGIYHLYWIYKTTKLTNQINNSKKRNATNNLLLCLFVPFYSVYWYHKTFEILELEDGESNDFRTLMLILSILNPVICAILLQDKINKIPTQSVEINVSAEKVNDPIREIKKYKELLEMNAITQAEFDAKKKELLDL